MQRNIRVLVVEPDKLPDERIIKNNLKTKQDIIGGSIWPEYLYEDFSIALICLDDATGCVPNRNIGHTIVYGTFIVVGDNDTGEDISLSDEQIKKYKDCFGEKSIKFTEEKVGAIKIKNNPKI